MKSALSSPTRCHSFQPVYIFDAHTCMLEEVGAEVKAGKDAGLVAGGDERASQNYVVLAIIAWTA